MQTLNSQNRIAQEQRAELIDRLSLACLKDGGTDVAKGLQFYRYSQPTQPTLGVYLPSLVSIAQGAKQVQLGDEILR